MPEFFGPLSRSAFLVNKKSLFLQKCQCIELLTVVKKNFSQKTVQYKQVSVCKMRLKIFGQEPPDTKQCTKIYIFLRNVVPEVLEVRRVRQGYQRYILGILRVLACSKYPCVHLAWRDKLH